MTLAAQERDEQLGAGGPARGAHRLLLPLGIMGAALALAVGVQLIFDPFRTHVPLCIVNHLTGIECPGCGALRAVHWRRPHCRQDVIGDYGREGVNIA